MAMGRTSIRTPAKSGLSTCRSRRGFWPGEIVRVGLSLCRRFFGAWKISAREVDRLPALNSRQNFARGGSSVLQELQRQRGPFDTELGAVRIFEAAF